MKRYFFILAALATLTVGAQDTGMWKSHPKYIGSGAQNLVDAGNKIYFQSTNHLFAYDKATGEVGPLDKDNGAFDLYVTGIYYNSEKNYTVVTYNNSNIDVIRSDGSVLNIPDIMDAIYNGPKAINDVTFAQGKMVLATQFGLVFINDQTMQICDTYYYNRNIDSAALVGGVLVVASDEEIFYDVRSNHDDMSRFVSTERFVPNAHIIPINSERFFIRSSEELDLVSIEITDEASFDISMLAMGAADYVQRTPTGFLANFKSQNCYYTMDSNGGNPTKVAASSEFYSINPAGDGTVWALGDKGLHVKGSTKYVTPNGWGVSEWQFYSAYNPGNGNVYVCRSVDNGINSKEMGSAYAKAKTEIWRYDGELWHNATPVGAPNNYGNYWMVFEPDQECSYFYSTRGGTYTDPKTNSKKYFGIISHVVNDTVLVNYNGQNVMSGTEIIDANAPLTFMSAITLDKGGNLWAVQPFRPAAEGPYIIALPKEKLHDKNVTQDDWVIPNLSGKTGSNKASTIAVSKGTDIKVFSIGSYNGPIMFWDNGGDVYNKNPRTVTYDVLPDADGTTIGWQYIRCLTPDTLGNVWAGSTSGFLYFNPAEAFEPNFKVHRIKIKGESEGGNDYFLDGEDVYCIAVDSLNRKWIGTATQGVYLLSDDGKSILAQFDASNSALPSNKVYTITPKPNTNSVMFVTSGGVAEYFNEIPDTGVENYDNVQAYPSPLKPEYTGYVTITGLVHNSALKITDRRGNVVTEFVAQGTTARWDGCDPATGERMPTGVYYVYAGKDATCIGTKAVAQIRIIK